MRSAWTQRDVAELRRLWALGQSYKDMGIALGRTRGAVVTKVHSLKLGVRSQTIKMAQARQEKVRTLSADDWPSKGECVYPIGEVGQPDFHFCRAPVENDQKPYCAEHNKLCYSRAYTRKEIADYNAANPKIDWAGARRIFGSAA